MNIVDAEWLNSNIGLDNVRIVDCRFQLGNPEVGYELYLQNHIPGAIYFHLENELSSKVTNHGGRHPLPAIEDFRELLENSGISNDTIVLAYDGGEGSFASRLWWLLKYVGHEKAYVLNKGYKGWVEKGFPVNDNIPSFNKTEFNVSIQSHLLATYEEVKYITTHPEEQTILVDSRERNRYLGLAEPIDKKAGHIPGAVNYVWTDGLEDGCFKNGKEQKLRFQPLKETDQIIVYCGSGITATPNVLALKEAGFQNVKLYAGSFSDWISYDENEVEVGENEK